MFVKKRKTYTLDQLRSLYEDFKPEAVLDFHDYGPLSREMILDIYSKFIEESFNAGQKRLLIITGKGEVVKPTVERRLHKDNKVEKFNIAGTFQGGKGAFEVTLK